jgi:hypothetical protein
MRTRQVRKVDTVLAGPYIVQKILEKKSFIVERTE